MTTSDHKKVFKQLQAKPVKLAKFIRFNQPKERSCGKALVSCRRCGTHRGVIRKYGLDICRRCFREIGPKLGFKKFL